MKTPLLILALGILGYFAYVQWSGQEAEPAPEVVEAKPEPVNFAIRARVRRLFEEWKRRNLGTPELEHGANAVSLADEFRAVRKALFEAGVHSEAAVRDVVVRSLREMGVAEKEISEVADGVMGLQ